MVSFYHELKRGFGFTSIVLLLAGILLLIYPQATSQVVCYLIGGLVLLQGVVSMINAVHLIKESLGGKFLIVWGGILTVLGAFFIIRTQVIISIIPVICGILILINGVADIIKAFQLRRNRYEKWLGILGMSVLKALLGVIILLNPFSTAIALIKFIGICMIYGGISTLWAIYCLSKNVIEVAIEE
ncbi:MAG: HdeD family acid-resistance protein [Aminipila sp.]